ncbi:MAG: hypothetical protein RSE45_03950, partial [Bacilli bacterium]
MKGSKKLCLIILSIILLNTSLSYAQEGFPWKFKKDSGHINDLYQIVSKEILEESEFFKAHIEYPYLQIEKLNDRENEDKIKTIQKINK